MHQPASKKALNFISIHFLFLLKLETTHAFYIGETHTTIITIKGLSLYNVLKDSGKGRQKRNINSYICVFLYNVFLATMPLHFSLQSSHRYPQAVLISICSKLDETKLK